MSGESPFSAASIQKAVHATLEDAFAAIPAGRSHAVLFDGTYSKDAGGTIRAMFVERVGNGWDMVFEGEVASHRGVAGQVVVSRSW